MNPYIKYKYKKKIITEKKINNELMSKRIHITGWTAISLKQRQPPQQQPSHETTLNHIN